MSDLSGEDASEATVQDDAAESKTVRRGGSTDELVFRLIAE